jgi:hypothetical protein
MPCLPFGGKHVMAAILSQAKCLTPAIQVWLFLECEQV